MAFLLHLAEPDLTYNVTRSGRKHQQHIYLMSLKYVYVSPAISFQVHCLQFLIYEAVSGGNMRKPGGLFGNAGSEIPTNELKQLETFFYKLSFFLHLLDYTGYLIYLFSICISSFLLCLWDNDICHN